MTEVFYKLKLVKNNIEIEVCGDKDFVEKKFKELTNDYLNKSINNDLDHKNNELKTNKKELSLIDFVNQKCPKSTATGLMPVLVYYAKHFEGIEKFNKFMNKGYLYAATGLGAVCSMFLISAYSKKISPTIFIIGGISYVVFGTIKEKAEKVSLLDQQFQFQDERGQYLSVAQREIEESERVIQITRKLWEWYNEARRMNKGKGKIGDTKEDESDG